MKITLVISALVLVATSAGGQILHSNEPLPRFEVATVRPWKPAPSPAPDHPGTQRKVTKIAPVGASRPLSDRLDFIGQVQLLIESAYGLPLSSGNRILGGPDWVRSESDRYEIVAKIDDSRFGAMQKLTPAQQQEQVHLMEQDLLANRFDLRVHFETREMPIYALVIGKGGPKLGASDESDTAQLSLLDRGPELDLTAKGITLDEFVRSPFLRIDERTIQNQTDLRGKYSFTLKWTREGPPDLDSTSDAPGLSAAIQEQLGLKLVPAKGPVEVIVIDHIERPSED